jgi:hypothetical protein
MALRRYPTARARNRLLILDTCAASGSFPDANRDRLPERLRRELNNDEVFV